MPRTTCPTCGAVLELADDMVGERIECGGCKAVFVAEPDGPAPRPSARGEDRPSRQGRGDDDRPSRRRRDDDRPSRRRDRFDDDGYDDRPRRRRQESESPALAITSLVLGVVSLPFALCCGLFSIPISLAGIVTGVIAIAQKRGTGMAVGGVVLSVLSIAGMILLLVFGIALNLANVGNNKANNGPPVGPQPPVNNRPPFNRR